MKPRDRCCCAIPTVNAGVYTILVEQFALGITAGTLSVATTHIVGAATWTWSKWIFAIICYVAAAVQVFGFIGVGQEKPIVFRRYLTLHIMTSTAAFSVAIAWIVISAARHSTAKSTCEDTFFSSTNSTSSSSTTSEGETLCQIFPWVDIGLMGGLWVLLAISQFYFYVVLSGYSHGQQEDHMKYDSLYSVNGLNEIPMTKRDPWDAHDEATSPPLGGPSRSGTRSGYSHPFPDYPQNARSYEAQPTPYYSDPYYSNNPPVVGGGAESELSRPEHAQAHPAEGSFGRKTPRLRKFNGGYY